MITRKQKLTDKDTFSISCIKLDNVSGFLFLSKKHTAMDYWKFTMPKLRHYKFYRSFNGLQENITAEFTAFNHKYGVQIVKNPLATYPIEGRVFKVGNDWWSNCSCYAFGVKSCDREGLEDFLYRFWLYKTELE